jgi:hypothetical protein
MKKWLIKIDFTFVFRLTLSIVMGAAWYTQNDITSGVFALFLAIYALVAAKYKIGCGYNACGYSTMHSNNYAPKEELQPTEFTELKK